MTHINSRVILAGVVIEPAKWAEVAQLVEHLTENQRVPSSSLGLGTLPILGNRLMVGHRPLEPFIQVRILVPQFVDKFAQEVILAIIVCINGGVV